MAWYAVYDKKTGELYSTGTVIDIEKLPEHLVYKELPEEVDFDVQEWDITTKEMKSKQPEVKQLTIDEKLAALESKIDSLTEAVKK